MRLPIVTRTLVLVPGEARNGNHDPYYGHAQQRQKLQKHEDVRRSGPQLRAHTVEQGNKEQSRKRNGLVDPRACINGIRADDCADKVLAKDDGDDGRGAGFEDHDRAPREEEARPFPEYLGEVDLCAAVEGDGTTELGVGRRAGPGEDAGHDPDYECCAWGARIAVDLRGRREDAGANDEADDEGEAIQICQALVLLQAPAVERLRGIQAGIHGSAEGRVTGRRGRQGEQVRGKVEGGGDGVGAFVPATWPGRAIGAGERVVVGEGELAGGWRA